MDKEILQSVITIITLIGFFYKFNKDLDESRAKLHARIDDLKQKHDDERVYVAENYIKKEEIVKLEGKIDRLAESITNVLQKVFEGKLK